jgi:hypothetical protein
MPCDSSRTGSVQGVRNMRAICKATAKKVRTRAFADSIGVVVVGGGFVDDGVEGARVRAG